MRNFFAGQLGAARRWGAITAAVLLSGCTLADQFSGRAVAYNLEAESARDQNLLLNIVRAAYRKPMQFTDITSATGTATATGTVGSSLLIGPHQSAAGSNLSPGFTFAGGPTFTMSTLNTKEFYSGILTPISNSLVSYYVSIGIPKPVLYTLLFGEIDVDVPQVKGGALKEIYHNSAASQAEWNDFQAILNALMDAGLTSELKDPDYFGPALSTQSLRDPAKLAALVKQKIDLVPENSGKSGEPAFWHAVKDDPKPHFCFDTGSTPRSITVKGDRIPVPEAARCGQKNTPKKDVSTGHPETLTTKTLFEGVTVKIRSLEGVLYFLGEIARSELGLIEKNPDPLKTPSITFKMGNGKDARFEIDNLFTINLGDQAQSISTSYGSISYSVPVDPSNRDHSAQVLEFAAQLLALNSSSKDLPSPGVVTLIGH